MDTMQAPTAPTESDIFSATRIWLRGRFVYFPKGTRRWVYKCRHCEYAVNDSSHRRAVEIRKHHLKYVHSELLMSGEARLGQS